MDTSRAGARTIFGPLRSQTSFLRALNAPFVAAPLFSMEPETPIPKVGEPLELAWPLYNPTGGLDVKPMDDIRDLFTVHRNELYTTTIRRCTVDNQVLNYLNKSWKIASRHPGVLSELYLYNNPLKHFMGEHVPNLISVRSGPGALDLGFELPNQAFLIEATADMPDVLKRRTIKTVEKLHARGVCHQALTLADIMIGADGQVYIHNFHHAMYIKENPAVFLFEANKNDFALELRRLKYKLGYENAKEKEFAKFRSMVNRSVKNDLELKQAREDPFYSPQFIKPSRDEELNPPLLSRGDNTFWEVGREPKRFIMPGQKAEDFERALEGFYEILRSMEDEEKDLLTTETELSKTLKRKRSNESEECPPSSKKVRQSPGLFHSSDDETTANRTVGLFDTKASPRPLVPKLDAFRHDSHRSKGIGLVSSGEFEPSIQENNLVSELPKVVVRDFAKGPLPRIGDRLKPLDESPRYAWNAITERERDEQRCRVAEASAGPALGQVLRYSGRDTHAFPLNRHETFIEERLNPSTKSPNLVHCWSALHPRPFQTKRDDTEEPITKNSAALMWTGPSSVHRD